MELSARVMFEVLTGKASCQRREKHSHVGRDPCDPAIYIYRIHFVCGSITGMQPYWTSLKYSSRLSFGMEPVGRSRTSIVMECVPLM